MRQEQPGAVRPRMLRRVAAVPVLILLFVACLPEPQGPAQGPAVGSAVLRGSGWLGSAQRGISDSEYQLGDMAFSNRAQGLGVRFGPDGAVTVTPRGGERGPLPEGVDDFSLTLRMVAPGPMEARAGDCDGSGRVDLQGDCLRRAELRREGLLEWWTNSESGVEQGWVIQEGPVEIEVAVQGMEWVVAADGSEATFRAGSTSLRYGSLLADDADGRDLPVWFEPVDGGLRVVVDDEGATYPVTIDPLLSNVAWTAESNQADARFGESVSSAGDVNGDGYGDVVVGAPFFTNGETNEGRAFLYLGSASGLPASASWTAESNQAEAQLG